MKMTRILSKIPPWMQVTIACVCAAGLLVVAVLGKGATGWGLVAILVLGPILAASAIGIPQLQRWQDSQDKKLDLKVIHSYPADGIPAYPGNVEEVSNDLVSHIKTKLLSSLPKSRKFPVKTSEFHLTGEKGLTLGEIQDLRDRRKAGDKLTEEEVEKLAKVAESEKRLAEIVSEVSKGMLGGGRYDVRSQDEFRAEVESYAADLKDFIESSVLWSVVNSGKCNLSLRIDNPTKKLLEKVEVEIYIRGASSVYDPEDLELTVRPPSLPVPYGKKKVPDNWPPNFDFAHIGKIEASLLDFGRPVIENGEVCKVSFESVDIRPEKEVDLPAIALILLSGEEVREVEVSWDATATNVDGRLAGKFIIDRSPTPLVAKIDTIASACGLTSWQSSEG